MKSAPNTDAVVERDARLLADVGVAQPSTRALIETAIALMPAITDDRTADLFETLALALIDRDEILRVTSELLAGALADSHTKGNEIIRLRKRLATLLDERRPAQRSAA